MVRTAQPRRTKNVVTCF